MGDIRLEAMLIYRQVLVDKWLYTRLLVRMGRGSISRSPGNILDLILGPLHWHASSLAMRSTVQQTVIV